MNKDLLNILSNSNKEINNQKLIDYVSGRLSPEDAHEVEKLMADNNFTNDAVEGLQNIKPGKDLELLADQLNRDLQKKLAEKKRRKEKRKLKEEPWILFAVALILVLIVVAYLFLKKFPML